MRRLFLILTLLTSSLTNAAIYEMPPCYSTIPTTCTFDDMTLAMCNSEGKKAKKVFLISQKIYIPGGNKFGSADGKAICVVHRVKGSEPAKYEVAITK